MRLACAICGRATEPFVLIGGNAIGPKCAKRAGLVPGRVPKGSRLQFVQPSKKKSQACETRDLFEEMGLPQ